MPAQGPTRWLAAVRRRLLPALRAGERLAFGGPRRGRLLERLHLAHVRSVIRRTWVHILPAQEPPFFDHRLGGVLFALAAESPFGWRRAYYASELIREGDTVLDIGCGDGFFARRFFAPLAGHVDAIDLDPAALEHARAVNAAPNVAYSQVDAVRQDFPSDRYDVIVWDGAIGHFAREDTDVVLAKIAAALDPSGMFVGSESLGSTEGSDHLQWFEDLDDLGAVMERHFERVEVKEVSYETQGGALRRREGFWRCGSDFSRAQEAGWRPAAASA